MQYKLMALRSKQVTQHIAIVDQPQAGGGTDAGPTLGVLFISLAVVSLPSATL